MIRTVLVLLIAAACAQAADRPQQRSERAAVTNSSGLVCSLEDGRLWLRRTMVKDAAPTKRQRDEYSKVVDSLTSTSTGRVWRVAFDNSPDRRPRKGSKKTLTNKPKTKE